LSQNGNLTASRRRPGRADPTFGPDKPPATSSPNRRKSEAAGQRDISNASLAASCPCESGI
jgi:hypothetical protein